MMNNLISISKNISGTTITGKRFESLVCHYLEEAGWDVTRNYKAGYRLGSKSKMLIDVHAARNETDIFISCFYQQVSGSASFKLPYEYMCLSHAMKECLISKGYLVLFGEFAGKKGGVDIQNLGSFKPYMSINPKIEILELQDFVKLINRDAI